MKYTQSNFLKALKGENRKERPPIWLMRQAGRYLPRYRAFRKKHSFLEMCHEPELAAAVTLLPLEIFDFDAAILFSDILVVAEAFGVGLRFEEGVGPIIERPLHNKSDVALLPKIDVKSSLAYVAETIILLKPQLKIPLIGFCGAPFTVASYMIEGGASRDFKKSKQWLFSDASFHSLLEKITQCTIDYLHMQIAAGVDAIQIFESWAHLLAFPQFQEFSLRYLDAIVNALRCSNKEIPIILFCRGAAAFAESLALLKPDALSVDWNCDIAALRKKIPSSIALQGNLDPDLLHAPAAVIQREATKLLNAMKNDPGYIFNLGHGILPETPLSAVHALIECVH